MNFLAHLYLSGDDPEVKVGNFIGDFVKGRDVHTRFTRNIALGIELHREIDHFTDLHPLVKRSKARLWATYRHYSAVIVDLYYDHFLARNWNEYHASFLPDYADGSYKILLQHDAILPEKVKWMLPHMMKGDWLSNYARVEGIHRALSGMARRTRFVSNMEHAATDLQAHYPDFEADFRAFFPELQRFAENWRGQLLVGS
jgi:acyl carrier protein phosphodiesterase